MVNVKIVTSSLANYWPRWK